MKVIIRICPQLSKNCIDVHTRRVDKSCVFTLLLLRFAELSGGYVHNNVYADNRALLNRFV